MRLTIDGATRSLPMKEGRALYLKYYELRRRCAAVTS